MSLIAGLFKQRDQAIVAYKALQTVGFEELSKIGAGNISSFPKYKFLRNINSRLYLESFLRPFSFNLYNLYFRLI